MGLSLTTFRLAVLRSADPEAAEWFEGELALVNALLVQSGSPEHSEPEHVGDVRPRRHRSSFPYRDLHHLWRAFARVRLGVPVTPLHPGEDPSDDPAIDEVALPMQTHLLCHADNKGYYVPVDFEDVVFDEALPGGMMGSSLRLLDELIEVAPAIGVVLVDGVLMDEEAARLADDADPCLCTERRVWLALYEGARVSIEGRTILVFA